ncbi:M48 family metallopeptidase [Lysobacter korlensis]|uniref:M48 family metallopeptidase n=1 Tax=Lysobacter korlensis TaxID=553636 RepID=A0ABV6RKB6_9GAMM
MIGGFRAAPKPRTVTRETLAVTLPDGRCIDVQRVRDPRAKRMRLIVGLHGVRLTLPLRTSEAAAAKFLREHHGWLVDALGRRGDAPAALQAHVTAQLPLRGVAVPVLWQTGRLVRIGLEGDAIVITAPEAASEAALRRALRDFYEAQARADVGRWLPRYLGGLPRAPSRLRFRMMSSLWGSLTRDGAMTLDLALVLGAPAAFEYVLVHELCHLLHMDHSPAFWREVEARCPDWRMHRAYFREGGRGLKPALHALCAGA